MKKAISISCVLALIVLSGCTQAPEYATIQVGEKEGLIKNQQEMVVKPIFKRVASLQGIEKNYQHPNYLNIHWFHDNGEKRYAVVENTSGKLGIIDTNGKMLVKPLFDSISTRFNGYIKIELNGKIGLLDEDFDVVLKPQFDKIDDFVYDTAVVEYKGKYGCIDRDMNLVLKPIYDHIYTLNEGIRRIELNDKWGFTNESCEVVVKPSFEYLEDFSNGIAKFQSNKLWGYIRPDGTILSKNIFTNGDSF